MGKPAVHKQFVEVGGDGQERRGGEHRRQPLGGENLSRAAKDVRLFFVRNRQRKALLEA